jgi:hypothetical protein
MPRILLALLATLALATASPAATATWTGATSGQWSVATNWSGNVPPSPGDDLLFPTGANGASMVNDYPAGTFFRSLTFTVRQPFALSGNSLSLGAGGLTALTGPGPHYLIDLQPLVVLTQPQTWSASGDITARLTGTGGLSCSAPSLMVLTLGRLAYTGPTSVGGSTILFIDTVDDVLTPIIVNAGGVFSFTGTPTIAAPLSIRNNGTFRARHAERIVATASVTLAGNVAYEGSLLPPGTVRTIIENQSGVTISGTFSGYPEGAMVPMTDDGGQTQLYRISYLGGVSGHDVTLTAQAGPALNLSASPTAFAPGTMVTLTATTVPAATGTVTFWAQDFIGGEIPLGTVQLDGTGTAVLLTTALGALDADGVFATYSGSPTASASRSANLHLDISGAGVTFAFTATATTLNAQLAFEPPPPLQVPAGTIEFYEGSTLLGSATLQPFFITEIAWGSHASLDLPTLTPGRHIFHALWIPADSGQPQKLSGTAEVIVANQHAGANVPALGPFGIAALAALLALLAFVKLRF